MLQKIITLVIETAHAGGSDGPLGAGFETVVTERPGRFFELLPGMISSLASWVLGLVAIICTLMIIIGGFQYLFGAIEGKAEGKQTVIYALTGLIIALLAFVIVSTVAGVLG